MIRILSAKQIKEWDNHTIQHEPISSIDLMERACKAFVNWFVQHVDTSNKVGIVCGTGNNGGDGLGIARLLADWGYPVKIWIVRGLVTESPDFKINLERIQNKLSVYEIISSADQGLFEGQDVLVDAIFGSGLSRPVEGIYAQAIRCMNEADALRIGLDVPSGLSADQPSSGDVVKAHCTISFQVPKLAFFLPQSYAFTGEWIIVDIGLNKSFLTQTQTTYYQLTRKDVCKIIKQRSKFDHKGTYGHALVIAGSYGKMGAALLSSRAVLRAGAGLLTVHIPKCGYSILQTGLPEAMVNVDKDEYLFTDINDVTKYTAIGIGPGLGQAPQTIQALSTVLKDFKKPLVVDADALNMVALNPTLRSLIPENSILTPHPKEFERLVGKWANDFERLSLQRALSAQLKSVIILKGAFTSIALPNGELFFNSTGNPGMATGGSGDVLTGILTGLLAQGYSPKEAAFLGVYLHGLSGDLAAQEKGMNSLMASDLVEFLPHAFVKTSRE
jgi:hydroxyethylthiazole kinase-like uncharacterized protein yjeF